METKVTIEAALMPQEKTVIIGGHPYKVRRLTIRQLLQLGAIASTIQTEVRERMLKDVAAGKPDMLALMGSIHDEDLARIMSVLLKEDSISDMSRFAAASLLEVSELAATLTDVNDFNKIFANFQRAAENTKGLLTQTHSLPSSQK